MRWRYFTLMHLRFCDLSVLRRKLFFDPSYSFEAAWITQRCLPLTSRRKLSFASRALFLSCMNSTRAFNSVQDAIFFIAVKSTFWMSSRRKDSKERGRVIRFSPELVRRHQSHDPSLSKVSFIGQKTAVDFHRVAYMFYGIYWITKCNMVSQIKLIYQQKQSDCSCIWNVTENSWSKIMIKFVI